MQEDKLRPKDISKLSRLDKLRHARERKQSKLFILFFFRSLVVPAKFGLKGREERRKKGIVESDGDDDLGTTTIVLSASTSSGSSEEEDTRIPNLDEDVEGFIIEDEDEIDSDDREHMESMLPSNLSQYSIKTMLTE